MHFPLYLFMFMSSSCYGFSILVLCKLKLGMGHYRFHDQQNNNFLYLAQRLICLSSWLCLNVCQEQFSLSENSSQWWRWNSIDFYSTQWQMILSQTISTLRMPIKSSWTKFVNVFPQNAEQRKIYEWVLDRLTAIEIFSILRFFDLLLLNLFEETQQFIQIDCFLVSYLKVWILIYFLKNKTKQKWNSNKSCM